MANSDSSQYVLRYNEISQDLEYGSGINWFPVTLASGAGITQLTGPVTAGPGSGSQASSITAGAIHPAAISTTATDDFTFPRDVVVGRNLTVDPGTIGGAATLSVGNASSGNVVLNLKTASGTQAGVTFNANGDKWELLLNSDGTLQIFDIVNGLFCHTTYPHGGESLTKLTTTQKNALTAVEGMEVYDTTLHAPCWYDGTTWQTVAHV